MNIKHILTAALLLSLFSSCNSEESKVKNISERFIRGRIALDKGDSTDLKEVTEDSLFRLIMLNKKYESMIHAPIMKPDLRIHAVSAEIRGDSATCIMSGFEPYRIHLLKYGKDWKVKGENDIYPDSYLFASVNENIRKQQKFNDEKPGRDSVLKPVNAFFDSVKKYFYKPDPSLLAADCSPETVAFIQKLIAYVKRKVDPAKLADEMSKEVYAVGDVIIGGDRATFKFYNEETSLMLKKVNGRFIITGFNGRPSEYFTDEQIAAEYADVLHAMKLVRAKNYRKL